MKLLTHIVALVFVNMIILLIKNHNETAVSVNTDSNYKQALLTKKQSLNNLLMADQLKNNIENAVAVSSAGFDYAGLKNNKIQLKTFSSENLYLNTLKFDHLLIK